MDRASRRNYRYVYAVAVGIFVAGILMGDYREIPSGMKAIFYNNAVLITDYVAVAGIAGAFFNVALVTGTTAFLMQMNHLPMHGRSIFTLGLMSGFSFFGKNIYTMWFILLGTWLLSVVNKEKFSKNLISGLLATSLGPIIGVAYLHHGVTPISMTYALLAGIVIGFVVPLLAAHTNGILRGLSLYNGGFAVGLLALIMVPVMAGYGFDFSNTSTWSTGNNTKFAVFLYVTSLICITSGYKADPKYAWTNYRNLLRRPGVAKDDFTQLDGMGAVLINMGVNIAICTSYVLITKGDLNGPTLGGIFTVAGFSANGKHARNIVPIMLGIYLGSSFSTEFTPNHHGVQMAIFLGTTLAPISGTYGIVAGILAGVVHSSAILQSGLGYSGANLYNNGFCGGVVSVVCYPVFHHFLKENTYAEPSPSRTRKAEEVRKELPPVQMEQALIEK